MTIKTLLSLVLTFILLDLNGQTAFESLNYLYEVSGEKTIAGIHNREPNNNPDLWTDSITVISGKTPALWSGDFLFTKKDTKARWTMIYEAEEQWENGALINIMWHACSPLNDETCNWTNGVLDQLTDDEWNLLITDGTDLNNTWKARMDDIATYLSYLKDRGIEVMFRPFHEMNQPVFWWAGRKGSNGTAKLYQLTHDYLTDVKGLANLIWVWNVQDFSTLATDLVDYNPGSDYWDILTLDMYGTDGANYTTAKYDALVATANGKPIGIGECQLLPTAIELQQQPDWAFFMSWAELTLDFNTNDQIRDLYAASNIITLEQMPGWSTPLSNEQLQPGRVSIYPNPTRQKIQLSVDEKLLDSRFVIYNPMGEKVLEGKFNQKEIQIDLDLASGLYLMKTSQGPPLKFIIE